MRSRLVHSIIAFLATVALAGTASAQMEDFATCPASLPQCDSNTDSCCYRTFDPIATDRAIIIPMDRCHQVVGTGTEAAPTSEAPKWCQEPGPSADDGMYEAYGLVYRLMQNDIPVYWMINPTKEPLELMSIDNYAAQTYTDRDIDFWVVESGEDPPHLGSAATEALDACPSIDCVAAPIARLNASLGITDLYNYDAFPVRGGSFMIAAEDRARFNEFWLRTGEFAGLAGQSKYDFSAVDLYEMQTGAQIVYQEYGDRTWNGVTWVAPTAPYNVVRAGPVAVRIDYAPPRLARQAPAGVSNVWLSTAKLADPAQTPDCLSGDFYPEDAVYCDMTEVQMREGKLVDGEFVWAWIDNWGDNSPCATFAEQTQVDKVLEFMTAVPGVRPGGHVMFMESVIEVFEGCPGREPAGKASVGLASDNSSILDKNNGDRIVMRYPANLFMQWGDVAATFASGSPGSWRYANATTVQGVAADGYKDMLLPSNGGSLVRLLSQDNSGNVTCAGHRSEPECDSYGLGASDETQDSALYFRYDNDPANGLAFYMAGNNVNSHGAHLRMILNALIALPVATVPQTPAEPIEVSRASPTIAVVDGAEAHYQGTYEIFDPPPPVTTYGGAADDDTFEFPYMKGHMRAVDTGVLGATELAFTDVTPIFDAAVGIPDPTPAGCTTWFGPSCRTVFTNVTSTPTMGELPKTYVTTGNAAVLKPFMAPSLTTAETETLISRVLAGVKVSGAYQPRLGGVDRSTVAVIESSPLAGGVRPTIVYFGGLDGMLHAVCAEALGPCTSKGQELWAFVPRTQLPLLRRNTQRIDGSVKVTDVFDDFGGGNRQWRTILTFQTGSGEAGFGAGERAPAIYALDITEPDQPKILWEVTPPTPTARGAVEQGVGLGLALGPVRIGGETKNLVFAQTNNGGIGSSATRVMAINTVDGSIEWAWDRVYPAPPTRFTDGTDTIRPDDSGVPEVPSTGIPGGVAAFDMDDSGNLTHLAVSTLYGELWLLDAADGSSEYGSLPLFQFATDYHPIGAAPTIYFDQATGKQHAIVVSGGYADPIGSSWAWSPDAVNQYAVSVALDTPVGVAPVTELGTDFDGNRAFVITLAGGQRSVAQAVVAGNELFITTETEDVNSSSYGLTGGTGKVLQYSLSGGTFVAQYQTSGGAGSVDVRNGTIFAGSGSAAQKITPSSFNPDGKSTELTFEVNETRQLWLRLQ